MPALARSADDNVVRQFSERMAFIDDMHTTLQDQFVATQAVIGAGQSLLRAELCCFAL